MKNITALRHDTILRWRVTSDSRPDIQHVVDLGANGGIGACSCEHFQFRLQPKINDGNRCVTSTRCVHILVARGAFTDTMVQHLSLQKV